MLHVIPAFCGIDVSSRISMLVGVGLLGSGSVPKWFPSDMTKQTFASNVAFEVAEECPNLMSPTVVTSEVLNALCPMQTICETKGSFDVLVCVQCARVRVCAFVSMGRVCVGFVRRVFHD